MSIKKLTGILVFVFLTGYLFGQQAHPFDKEVHNLLLKDSLIKDRKNIILFTGSSSIRLWDNLASDFPNNNVLNRAFGGSSMRDLLHFTDQLIISYNPKTIFIYEGDNDLGSGKVTSKEILASADSLLTIIRAKLPKKVKVYFISPKPSIARWNLRDQYIAFNKDLKTWTQSKKEVYFIDVWPIMLNSDGSVKKELFIEDGLHMNRKGYELWLKKIQPFVR